MRRLVNDEGSYCYSYTSHTKMIVEMIADEIDYDDIVLKTDEFDDDYQSEVNKETNSQYLSKLKN